MKKLLIGLALALAATTAQADFFDSNDGEWKMGPYGPYWDESNWPVWTPMYWMEEFMDAFDDDDDDYGYGGGYGGSAFNNTGYGYPQQMPQQPYYGYPTAPAYGNPQPQQAPAAASVTPTPAQQ